MTDEQVIAAAKAAGLAQSTIDYIIWYRQKYGAHTSTTPTAKSDTKAN